MLIVISPAKKLNFSNPANFTSTHSPQLIKHTQKLVNKLKKLSQPELQNLMHISENLAKLNFQRYQNFNHNLPQKEAILAFNGDVYQNINAQQFNQNDMQFAQKYLRILSGLYGILKPLDQIQPHRLEMGTTLTNEKGEDLYDFWGHSITKNIIENMKNNNSTALINLASNEYFKSVKSKNFPYPIISIQFKQWRNNKAKTIAIMAKKARGAMTQFAIKNRITDPQKLKDFSELGYNYNENLSENNVWVFLASN